MARRVFFSFHYEDVATFRANVVRQHWRLKPEKAEAGFFDASMWEKVKKEGDLALKRLINSGLENTSVTSVLIGTETYKRRWVRYEIIKSYDRGNGLVGVHINSVRDKNQKTFLKGNNPFDYLGLVVSNDGKKSPTLKKTKKGLGLNLAIIPLKQDYQLINSIGGKAILFLNGINVMIGLQMMDIITFQTGLKKLLKMQENNFKINFIIWNTLAFFTPFIMKM